MGKWGFIILETKFEMNDPIFQIVKQKLKDDFLCVLSVFERERHMPIF